MNEAEFLVVCTLMLGAVLRENAGWVLVWGDIKDVPTNSIPLSILTYSIHVCTPVVGRTAPEGGGGEYNSGRYIPGR